jgi:hypothetical protein
MIIKIVTKQDALESLSKELFPTYKFMSNDDDMIIIDTSIDDGIVDGKYKSNTTCPFTEEEIEAELNRLQTDYDNKEYQRKRASEYAPLGEQLDMQYHDVQDGTETWIEHIKEVKAKYPKDSE